jgi:chorismate mutase
VAEGHDVKKDLARDREATPQDEPRSIDSSSVLADWRRRIDAIDDQLMRLLNSRSACAVEIGRIKREVGLPVYAPEREAWILDRVMRENPGPLDPLAVRRVFERIIDESRRLERVASEAEAEEGQRLEEAAIETLRKQQKGTGE